MISQTIPRRGRDSDWPVWVLHDVPNGIRRHGGRAECSDTQATCFVNQRQRVSLAQNGLISRLSRPADAGPEAARTRRVDQRQAGRVRRYLLDDASPGSGTESGG